MTHVQTGLHVTLLPIVDFYSTYGTVPHCWLLVPDESPVCTTVFMHHLVTSVSVRHVVYSAKSPDRYQLFSTDLCNT
jgi:hypothetical protein